MSLPSKRILIAIPAYNEAGTIAAVIESVRTTLPDYDLLVVNDGSKDTTGQILEQLDATVATHFCNLGYGRGIQTAIMYALDSGMMPSLLWTLTGNTMLNRLRDS